MGLFLPPRPALKAMTGPGALGMAWQTPLASLQKTPQKLALQAQALYHENNWVYDAEHTVSTRAGGVAWHLEDEQDNEVGDEAKYQPIRDLLEKPQAALPIEERQGPLQYRRNLWTITLRHMGLVGWTFWYLNQASVDGIPLAILYLNPSRVFAVMTKGGNLVGWTLDRPMEEGGTPLELENVLPFYFDPADAGPYGIGLVESIWSKAQISQLADKHIAATLAAGGRLTGILGPKVAGQISDDEWAQFVRDYRNITENPEAAKRLQIVKGPVDYIRTAATMAELLIPDLSRIGRDDVLAHWGVPGSQIGVQAPTGLNSGSTKGFDEAILWQGAIHTRLTPFWETVQYGLLDRFGKLGIPVELELEEPEFDDDTPLFAKLAQVKDAPLTNNEKRDIVGYAPLEEDLEEFGLQVWNTSLMVQVAGPGFEETPTLSVGVIPPPLGAMAPVTPAGTPPPAVAAPGETVGKATIRPGPFSQLRAQVSHTMVPRMRRAVADALSSQKQDVVARLRKIGLDHLRTRRADTQGWWIGRTHDKVMTDALKPHVSAIAAKVATKTEAILGPVLRPAKAVTDEFVADVTLRVLTKGAGRVTGINQTTRDAIAEAIAEAIDGAETIDDVIAAVEKLNIFDEYRSELIARTESAFAYNASSLGSYGEFGVQMVEPLDGDEDEECQARLARGTVSLDEAEADEDHPNGTLVWSPVVPDEPPAKASASTRVEYDELGRFLRVVDE